MATETVQWSILSLSAQKTVDGLIWTENWPIHVLQRLEEWASCLLFGEASHIDLFHEKRLWGPPPENLDLTNLDLTNSSL